MSTLLFVLRKWVSLKFTNFSTDSYFLDSLMSACDRYRASIVAPGNAPGNAPGLSHTIEGSCCLLTSQLLVCCESHNKRKGAQTYYYNNVVMSYDVMHCCDVM